MSLGTGPFGTDPFGTELPTALTGAPTLQDLSPNNLSVIAPLDAITFDVHVPGLIRRILVCVAYPATGQPTELAFDGVQFRAGYGTSTITALGSTVRHFVLRHTLGGWPSRPSPKVFAFDRAGLEL